MTDYRLKPNRLSYFNQLYALNLRQGILPGLVYLYLPALASRLAWGAEDRLWFAFLNGLTQNPVTSLILMKQLPECPRPDSGQLLRFAQWFEDSWPRLQFDTDRQKNKRLTVAAIAGYARAVKEQGSQGTLLTGSWPKLWERARAIPSFGRLSAFSYLEYVRIMGFGDDCPDLMFGDLEGSRSHRNGMLMLMGHDHLVMDRRAGTGVTAYRDLPAMAAQMSAQAAALLAQFRAAYPELHHAGNFTLESNLCTFKNHFFGRRYPGVYADMAQERIEWAAARGWPEGRLNLLRDIRAERLPAWLRIEAVPEAQTPAQRGAMFRNTGYPYRGEHFLTEGDEG